MTEQEIDALPAGRELDALVARRVMALTRQYGDCWSPHDAATGITLDVCLPLPPYSTDIDAARTVFARLMDDGRCIAGTGLFDDRGHLMSDPVAICRAALRAFKPH